MVISETDIAEVFAPFVVERFSDNDDRWLRIVAATSKRLRGQRLRRRLLGWLPQFRRTQRGLMRSYSEQWTQISFEQQLGGGKPLPFEWHGQGMLAYGAARKKLHVFLLARVLRDLAPRTVLEVGSGNGFNLFLLSQQFPDVAFTGLELTPGGIQAAAGAQRHEVLPSIVRQFSVDPLLDDRAHTRIRLCQGSAAELPFASKSFDLVFTVIALEQMEEIRRRALREISRVTKGYTAMIEPFRDWNQDGHRRDYIVSKDYFAAWIADLREFGLSPEFTLGNIPNKLDFRVGLVIAAAGGKQ